MRSENAIPNLLVLQKDARRSPVQKVSPLYLRLAGLPRQSVPRREETEQTQGQTMSDNQPEPVVEVRSEYR